MRGGVCGISSYVDQRSPLNFVRNKSLSFVSTTQQHKLYYPHLLLQRLISAIWETLLANERELQVG